MELKCIAKVTNLSKKKSSRTSNKDISNTGTMNWKVVIGVPFSIEFMIGGMRVHVAS